MAIRNHAEEMMIDDVMNEDNASVGCDSTTDVLKLGSVMSGI